MQWFLTACNIKDISQLFPLHDGATKVHRGGHVFIGFYRLFQLGPLRCAWPPCSHSVAIRQFILILRLRPDGKTEYPLIDETLIIALLSDYTVILSSHIDEVRDQLGILEASLVPDTDIGDTFHDDPSSSDQSSTKGLALDGMDEEMTRMALNDPAPFEDEPSKSLLSASSSSHLDVLSHSSRHSQSASASGSRTSDATSPTSLVDSEGGFEDDIALLKSLFPAMLASPFALFDARWR
jgi:hypothetical protein